MRLFFTIPLTVLTILTTFAQAPVNDDCSGIIDLGEVPYCSQPAQFTNYNATTSQIDPTMNVPACWNNLGDRDVWFQFEMPSSGALTDITVDIWGNVGGNGTLQMPQLAVYRGDCLFGGLAELSCTTAAVGINELHLDLFGLTPGATYFLRINDYSATATPNAGTFKLCVQPYVPSINIGDAPGSASCTGTLYDTGGQDMDYGTDEFETFVICPADFHQCIKINFESYATEPDFDFIQVYAGNAPTGTPLLTLDGWGNNKSLQISSDCVTVTFESDGSIVQPGFKMTWLCSAEVCDAPTPTLPSNATCDHAININGCDNVPQVMPLSPGMGDPNFIQDGVNQGCILFPSDDYNYSFFYFEAMADGKFGFAVHSANPADSTDIDFNVWGPINSVSEICDYVSTHQPIRSSWDEGADLTGLADVHPIFGTPVLDDFDCGSVQTPGTDPPNGPESDDFVRRLDVQTGEIYVVMLDDFDGVIENDGIAIDFSGTSDGVLGQPASPISASSDTVSCDGSPVQLQINGGTVFAWSPSTGLNCNTCPNPVAAPPYTVDYVVKAIGVCQNFQDTITVVIGPNVDIQKDTAICIGESVQLAHNDPQPGVTYVWTPDDGSLSDAHIANPIATPTNTTVYSLTATSGPCVVTKVVTVAVVDLTLSVNLNDTSICRGNAVPIQVTVNPANTSVQWSPLTQIQLSPDGLSALASPKQDITYKVTASMSGCKRQENIKIKVDSLPADLNIQPQSANICQGAEIALNSPTYSSSAFPNLQFNWQTGSGVQLPYTDYNVVVKPDQTTYYQRITSNGACIDTAEAYIVVIPVPNLSITAGDTKLCAGESTNLNVQNGGSLTMIQWTPPAGLSCSNCLNPVATPTTSTVYTLTGSITNGCSSTATVSLEVNAQPQYQLNSDTICAGDSIVLNLVPDASVNYQWSSIPPGFSSTLAQPKDAPAQTTTYLLNMENGCSVNTQFVVWVIPHGELNVSDSVVICAGQSTLISASGNYPGQFEWSNDSIGQAIRVSPVQSTTYYVNYAYPSPGLNCVLTDSVYVGINGQIGQVQFPADVRLCPGDSLTLNSIATPGASYSWTSVPPGFTSSNAQPPTFVPDVTTAYLVSTQLGDCVSSYEVDVTVFNPNMVVSNDTTVCAGELVTISADAFLTGDYLWTPGGTDPTFTVDAETDESYALHFEYGEGCIYTDTVKVHAVPSFTIKLVSDPDSLVVNAGEQIMLDAFIPGTNVSNFIFKWLENNQDSVGSSQQITVTPQTTDTTVNYLVTVTSPGGCTQTATITFRILQSEVKLANAFTPNGDGANDNFGLTFKEGTATVQKMEIYSRWGQKVFASSEPNAHWDGTIDNKPAPSDVYVYVIFYRDGTGALQYASGEVTLLR